MTTDVPTDCQLTDNTVALAGGSSNHRPRGGAAWEGVASQFPSQRNWEVGNFQAENARFYALLLRTRSSATAEKQRVSYTRLLGLVS